MDVEPSPRGSREVADLPAVLDCHVDVADSKPGETAGLSSRGSGQRRPVSAVVGVEIGVQDADPPSLLGRERPAMQHDDPRSDAPPRAAALPAIDHVPIHSQAEQLGPAQHDALPDRRSCAERLVSGSSRSCSPTLGPSSRAAVHSGPAAGGRIELNRTGCVPRLVDASRSTSAGRGGRCGGRGRTAAGRVAVRVARVGFPVVGVVGGGQLGADDGRPGDRARASRCGCSPATLRTVPRRSCPAPRWAPRTTSTRCAASPRAATSSPSTTSTCRPSTCARCRPRVSPCDPGPDALEHAQDKVVMRRRLTALGVPCPRWAVVHDAERAGGVRRERRLAGCPQDLQGRVRRQGCPLLDHGHEADVADWLEPAATPLLAEEQVDFTRELAVLVARSPHGQAAVWPVVETVQVDGVCREVIAPAPIDGGARTRRAAGRAADRRRARRDRRDGRRDVRHRRAACWSTSSRCARTTAATGRSRARAPASSSSTSARCSTCRSATPTMTAPHVAMSNVLGGDYRGHVLRLPALPRPRPGRADPHVRQGASALGERWAT